MSDVKDRDDDASSWAFAFKMGISYGKIRQALEDLSHYWEPEDVGDLPPRLQDLVLKVHQALAEDEADGPGAVPR